MRSLVVLFALAACAGKVPETKFYSFAEPSGRVTNGNGASVAIEPLATDSAYDDERISGVRIGLAPLEDFAYPLAAAILLPALWVALRRRRDDP